jgi:two-component system, OmpR family, phosphate regulon response regulator PhoB
MAETAKPKPLILVVDDVHDIVSALRLFFEGAGWEVATALDAPEALAKARLRTPDVAVCDVNLPSMLGWELCDKLKAMARPRPLPVIMLTARATELDEIRSYESSADEHFVKPPDFQALVAAVARHLAAAGRG